APWPARFEAGMADVFRIGVRVEADPQVGRGQARPAHFRPFDKDDRGTREVLVETRFTPLFARGESIKIKVVQIESREIIRFEQRECRTLHTAAMPEGHEQGAGEGGLPGAEVAR